MTLYLAFETIGDKEFVSSLDDSGYIDIEASNDSVQGIAVLLQTTDKIVTYKQAIFRLTAKLDLDQDERSDIKENWVDMHTVIKKQLGKNAGLTRVMKATFGESELPEIRIAKISYPTNLDIFQAMHNRLYMMKRLYQHGLNLGYVTAPYEGSNRQVEVDFANATSP